MFKFVEHTDNTEKQLDQKSKIKFKIMSLKVKGPMEYVPELVSYMPYGFNNASLCMLFFGLDTRLLLIDDIQKKMMKQKSKLSVFGQVENSES